jgi:hypothetical protein
MLGGNRTQSLDPDMTAFHALVAFGSLYQTCPRLESTL